MSNCPTEQSELMFQPLLSWCTVAELTQSESKWPRRSYYFPTTSTVS